MTYESIKLMIDLYQSKISKLTLEKQYLLNYSRIVVNSTMIKSIDSAIHHTKLKQEQWQEKAKNHIPNDIDRQRFDNRMKKGNAYDMY